MSRKQHTLEELIEYGKKQIAENVMMAQDGHPDEGRIAKKMDNGTMLIADDYSVLIMKDVDGFPLYNILVANFRD